MNTVQQIELAMQKLAPAELREVHEWLENFMEDQLEMTEEFEAGIAKSKRLFAAGVQPRVRQT